MVEVVRNWNLPSRITLMKARFLLASPVSLKVMVPVAPSTTTEDRAWNDLGKGAKLRKESKENQETSCVVDWQASLDT